MTTRDFANRVSDRASRRSYTVRANLEAFFALIAVALAIWAVSQADAGSADATRTVYAAGRIVPIPASIPHEEGDMVDRRILPDLQWIAAHYPIYVTDGYSGPLPNGTRSGCNRCHTRHSDHYNGLAVDLVPEGGSAKCDKSWAPITRLAHWAEPVQEKPRPPFRWVGYDGDTGHGCGNHLHLSWNHAPAPEDRLAEWVEVLPAGLEVSAPPPTTETPPASPPLPKPPRKGPTGGVSSARTGGVSARVD
jgi:hypothetical protein